ncbi:ribosomal protein L22/L17, partial [Vararia minispora EC-137]
HKYSTASFKISHRKLNKLGRQIAGKPVDMAIMQMQFSEKRASKRIRSMLVVGKQHAIRKGIDPAKMIVSEAWVGKGARSLKRVDIKARGRIGIKVHPEARMSVIFKEGKTREQIMKEQREFRVRRAVSSGLMREDIPIRNNVSPQWAW